MVESEIVTREGDFNDAEAFASLHASNLARERELDILKLYYQALLRQKGCISVCALHGDEVVGFACAVHRQLEVIPLLSRHPLQVGRFFLRHPSVIGRILVRVFQRLRAQFAVLRLKLPSYECRLVLVRKEYRNMGVGTSLTRALNQAMEARQISAAFLWVSSTNGPALRVYEKLGYVPLARDGGSVVMVIRFRQESQAKAI